MGCAASGKTTLAKKISKIIDVPVYHLDSIFWVKKGGIKQDLFLEKITKLMQREGWVIEGDFSRSITFEPRLHAADIIIYYDLSKIIIYWRLLKRLVKNFSKVRAEMPGNNTELSIFIPTAKHIWNFRSTKALEKIEEYKNAKKVFILKTLKDEKKLFAG